MKKHCDFSNIVLGAFLSLLLAPLTHADFDLQITEIWMGQDGTDVTEDWFEITNFGDMPWIKANHGGLYMDDDSLDPATADSNELLGITQIDPGESVVFVDSPTDGEAVQLTRFHDAWDSVLGVFQVGFYYGPGLGQGDGNPEDVVGLWLGLPTTFNELIDAEGYPSTEGFNALSYDVVLQEYSTVGNAAGAAESATLGGPLQVKTDPAIGSPGRVAVPEPSTVALAVFCLAGIVLPRCRLRGKGQRSDD